MNKKPQEKLFKKYPKIFQDKDKLMSETCMCWGIEHGPGWYDILDNLCSLIQSHVDNSPRVCKDSKFKQWSKQLWNRIAWNHIFYPIGRKFCKLDSIPKSYLNTDPKYNEYKKIWNRWYKYSDKWQLKSEYKKPPYNKNRQVIFVQVKEKYGTLRVYCNNADEYVCGLISMAEAMSNITCEECGSTKDIKKTKGWIKTLCGECFEKNKK